MGRKYNKLDVLSLAHCRCHPGQGPVTSVSPVSADSALWNAEPLIGYCYVVGAALVLSRDAFCSAVSPWEQPVRREHVCLAQLHIYVRFSTQTP